MSNNKKINAVTRQRAAELLGVTVRTIDRYASAGYLKRLVDARGRVAFDENQVLAMNEFEPETAETLEVQA